ncbi:MAG: lipoprotein [Bacteroidales bacterium]|nr:lipoprotein [Bacteroidales bacterium]
MKKLISILFIVALVVVSSCSSSDTMYERKSKKTNKINTNYKVRGNTKSNGSTYRTY